MNKIYETLLSIDAIDENSIEKFYPEVRDRDDIQVLRCNKSGVIFLSKTDHIDEKYYEEMDSFIYWGHKEHKDSLLQTIEDDQRRADDFRKIICGKKWIDIGTGNGGILELLSKYSSEAHGVELQKHSRDFLINNGYKIFNSISSSEDNYEVVSMFHVLEHLTDPLRELEIIRSKMKDSGHIIIEVPHAKDFLISFLELESFKSFTFWSEHLVLHTKDSLTKLLQKVGFRNIIVKSYQRYSLANHLHWLSKNKPNGHNLWFFLDNEGINKEYSNLLSSLDKTDTLILIAQK